MYIDSDSTDEEFEGILKKAIDVEIPQDFDPTAVPLTGEEYLHHVIYERSKCKKWVTAEIDQSKFVGKQTFSIIKEQSISKAPTNLLPSKHWQQEKIDQFTEFNKFIQTKLVDDATVVKFDTENFIEQINNNPPLFSKVTKYSQAAKLTMLQIISKHLNDIDIKNGINENLGAWIFALLTLLEKPLSPDNCYHLREFAKKCAMLRASLPDSTDKNVYTSLNLFICIIAKYFNQLDLCD